MIRGRVGFAGVIVRNRGFPFVRFIGSALRCGKKHPALAMQGPGVYGIKFFRASGLSYLPGINAGFILFGWFTALLPLCLKMLQALRPAQAPGRVQAQWTLSEEPPCPVSPTRSVAARRTCIRCIAGIERQRRRTAPTWPVPRKQPSVPSPTSMSTITAILLS